jgi:Cap4 dsDNA endonuclease
LTYRGKNSYKGTGIYVISLLEGNLSSVPSFTSYHDLVPLESGGVIARSGFDFQDHVSAGYCLDMLACEELLAVWCETLDDITLVWRKDSQEKFEFVQVKNNKFSHFWSVAELCKPGKGKSGEATISGSGSILEKSLAHEQGAERCSFRLVTSLPVNDDLQILTLPLSSPKRKETDPDFTKLCKQIEEKIPDFKSCRGSNVSSWLSRVVWEAGNSTEALTNRNLLKLRRIGNDLEFFLAEDQWDELYKKVLHKVKCAGDAKWEENPSAKKFQRNDFLALIKDLMSKAQHPGIGGKGGQLREKMERAKISADTIERAQEQRIAYRSKILNPGYMDLSKRMEMEMNIMARLHQLISRLDTGKLEDTGIEFHHRCLEELTEIQHNVEEVPLYFLQGYMYYSVDRCIYRFSRVAS